MILPLFFPISSLFLHPFFSLSPPVSASFTQRESNLFCWCFVRMQEITRVNVKGGIHGERGCEKRSHYCSETKNMFTPLRRITHYCVAEDLSISSGFVFLPENIENMFPWYSRRWIMKQISLNSEGLIKVNYFFKIIYN